MSMRDYDELENVKIPSEQERIMDIICDAWEECRESDCPCDNGLQSKHSIFACTALKYAKKIHEAGYTPVKWIDVNDRLPEESTNTPVNIVWKNTNPEPYYENIKNKPFVGTAYYYNGKWWWFSCICDDYLEEYGESDIDCMDDGIVVTHWMPIPAPPEVEQGSK